MANVTVSTTRRGDWIDLLLLTVGVVLIAAAFGLFYWAGLSERRAGGGGETAVVVDQTVAQLNVPLPFPATEQPRQTKLPETAPATVWERGNTLWTLTPRATFAVSARVLGMQRYNDWQGAISPVDLAIAWGDLSNPAVDQHIQWSQANRWYHYRWQSDSPYQFEAIRDESTNVHIIPANETIAEQLRMVENGDIVYLQGQLVDITYEQDGEAIRLVKTSLSRKDTGGGACEILLLESLIVP